MNQQPLTLTLSPQMERGEAKAGFPLPFGGEDKGEGEGLLA
jgi:hypothetical protein